MLYTIFRIGDKEFKLRATAASIVALEKQLGGQNPLDLLLGVESGRLPPVSAVLHILHAAMQKYHHGMTFQKVMELYDEFIESGGSYTDLFPILIEVYRVSGFFPKTAENQETTDNPDQV